MNNKKGWLRIFEAFLAIVILISVILIVLNNRRAVYDKEEEILNLQANILEYVKSDDAIRSQVLSNNITGVENKIKNVIPDWINYSARVCNYDDICSLGFYVPKDVYTNEVLIAANLTYYNPDEAKKVKLFFWEKN